MMSHSSCCLANLMIKVMLLTAVSFTHGKNCDVMPANIRCKVSILEDGNAKINVSWHISRTAANYVHRFNVSCDCLFSGFVSRRVLKPRTTSTSMYRAYQHLMKLPHTTPCYDECQCYISVESRCFYEQSSDPITCYILPSAPKEPPIITSFPKRIISSDHYENLVQVNFMLPTMNLFCDTYTNIKSITVSITQSSNGAHQYHYNQLRTLKNDSGNYIYTFEFPAEQFQFWEPFDIAISVNNSVKSSPFSDYVTVRKDDIIRSASDYTFHCTCDFNAELSTYVLYLYWDLSVKVQHMLNSHFVTGFQFTMVQIGGDDDVTTYYMNDTNLTLHINLKPNEWYLLVGRILFIGSEESYGPEPFFIPFRTSDPISEGDHSSSSNDDGDDDDNYNSKYLITIPFIIVCLVIIIILQSVCISRTTRKKTSSVSNHRDYDDDYGNEDESSVTGPGIMLSVGSYLEHKEAPSVVEN